MGKFFGSMAKISAGMFCYVFRGMTIYLMRKK
jgi:hypothetical protein